MSVGITDLAHSIRRNSAASAVPIPLSRGQQLMSATLGHKSLASYQAAQAAKQEPPGLDDVRHLVPDYDLLVDRALSLGIALPAAELRRLATAAFKERLPRTRLHRSYSAFEEALREQVTSTVTDDAHVNSEAASANNDGIVDVTFELEVEFDKVTPAEPLVVELEGQVVLGIDTERPYSGHKVNFEASLTVARVGRNCFGSADVEVARAAMDYSWSDTDQDEQPPTQTLAQALAQELDIELAEAKELEDAEPQELAGQSGDMVYGYLFDFTDHASPELAEKLLAKHGSLQLEVGPNFFDGIHDADWLN